MSTIVVFLNFVEILAICTMEPLIRLLLSFGLDFHVRDCLLSCQ